MFTLGGEPNIDRAMIEGLRILAGAVDVVRQSKHDNPWWLAVYVLAINFGLAALRFTWVWISFRITAWVASRRAEEPTTKPTVRLIAAMSVGGVRGAITLAGVLTLPLALPDGTAFPARDLTIFLAAGVVELYRRRLEGYTATDDAARLRESDEIERQLRLVALRAEREAVFSLARAHAISDASSRELVRDIDLQEERFRAARH